MKFEHREDFVISIDVVIGIYCCVRCTASREFLLYIVYSIYYANLENDGVTDFCFVYRYSIVEFRSIILLEKDAQNLCLVDMHF